MDLLIITMVMIAHILMAMQTIRSKLQSGTRPRRSTTWRSWPPSIA